MIQYHNTTKLFYNKYLYKIAFDNSLASFFKKQNLPTIREKLDILQLKIELGEPLTIGFYKRYKNIATSDVYNAKLLYTYIKNKTDSLTFEDYIDSHKIRVEGSRINVYSNDESWLGSILPKLTDAGHMEFWKPKESHIDLLKNCDNIIIVNNPVEFEYKVTLKNNTTTDFIYWVEKNPTKARASSTLIKRAKNNQYIDNMYFYVKDEKVLQLIMLTGVAIRRVDKLICKLDLDK